MPSTQAPKNYSLRVDITPDSPENYWAILAIYQSEDGSPEQLVVERSIRLDNMYEQVEVAVQSLLRLKVNKLSAWMREQRKHNKAKENE